MITSQSHVFYLCRYISQILGRIVLVLIFMGTLISPAVAQQSSKSMCQATPQAIITELKTFVKKGFSGYVKINQRQVQDYPRFVRKLCDALKTRKITPYNAFNLDSGYRLWMVYCNGRSINDQYIQFLHANANNNNISLKNNPYIANLKRDVELFCTRRAELKWSLSKAWTQLRKDHLCRPIRSVKELGAGELEMVMANTKVNKVLTKLEEVCDKLAKNTLDVREAEIIIKHERKKHKLTKVDDWWTFAKLSGKKSWEFMKWWGQALAWILGIVVSLIGVMIGIKKLSS